MERESGMEFNNPVFSFLPIHDSITIINNQIIMKYLRQMLLVCFLFLSLVFQSCGDDKPAAAIVCPDNATAEEKLAAREIRKYIYLRTNVLLPLLSWQEADKMEGEIILVAAKESGIATTAGLVVPSLARDAFILKSYQQKSGKILLVSGGSPVSTLYAAYHLAEQMGVRFYLDGDVVPDEKIPFAIPELDIRQEPLFERRGIQPFHDFPEGPDWWNLADYKAIFAQLPKLKMNFFGLHTYPEGSVGPEPLTWIGLPEDVNPDGTVKSAYPARHFTTRNETSWGFKAMNRSEYRFGTGQLLDRDDFGADYMRGRTPWPKPEDEAPLFNDMGRFLADALFFAHSLGVKSCIGTEIPLVLPKKFLELLKNRGLDPESPQVRQRIYEGIFTRIKNTHPLDFYWFWTNENWTWKGESKEELANTIRDFDAATRALEKIKPGFKLATCGWVLGPMSDRAMFDNYLPKSVAFSSINRNLGWEPVDTSFVRISNREKWAIPWLEDDPGMTIPQLWVGRMRRDAADAFAYGCNGYYGIHWRTRVIGMNVSALAKAAWEQPWNPEKGKRIRSDQLQEFLRSLEGRERAVRDMECLDFYMDWCKNQFGEQVADSMALLFAGLDGVKKKTVKLDAKLSKLPRPATWGNGPGNILMNDEPWDSVRLQYQFVDKMERLRPAVAGPGNLERFDYWLNQFKYLRAMGKLACSVGLFKIGTMEMEKLTAPEKKRYAEEKLMGLLKREATELEEVQKYLVSTISTWGEMGTLCNWQQHVVPHYLAPQISQIRTAIGDSSWVPEQFTARLDLRKIVVPSPQTIVQQGKDYTAKVITFNINPKQAVMYWRTIGEKEFRHCNLARTSENYWMATLPGSQINGDFEYYLVVNDGEEFRYPVTAPELNFAVVRL